MLEVGLSPCPNDTFMFHAWLHGAIDGAPLAHPWFADIEQLNRRAIEDPLPVTKLSAAVMPDVAESYRVSTAGAALGRGCGPLVVVGGSSQRRRLADLEGCRVALPGRSTTAALLFAVFGPLVDVVEMRFDQIVGAVAAGDVDAGVVIHETRFTYRDHGLRALADLGEAWERDSGLPIPLGLIAIRRDLVAAAEITRALRDSVQRAFDDPAASQEFVAAHAQEMSSDVCARHIELYVNRFSIDVGEEGRRAVEELLRRSGRETELDWVDG